jgi:hypothetical protein
MYIRPELISGGSAPKSNIHYLRSPKWPPLWAQFRSSAPHRTVALAEFMKSSGESAR